MRTLLTLALLILITSCFSGKKTVEQGKQLFLKTHLGKNKVIGCILCHSLKSGQVIVGPSLAGISARAPYLVEGQSGREYLKSSIVNPDAYIVDGFLPATMFLHYQQELSDDEINALVDYLLHL